MVLTFLAVTLLAVNAIGQTMKIKQSEEAVELSGALGFSHDANAWGAKIGNSTGTSDLSLAYGQANVDRYDITLYTIGGFFSYHFMKENIISLSINTGYSYAGIVGRDALEGERNSIFMLGGTVYSRVEGNENVYFIPFLAISLDIISWKADGYISRTDNSSSFSVGAILGTKTSQNLGLFLSPAISITEGEADFSINAGFLFYYGGGY
jgi:hypothetical protein